MSAIENKSILVTGGAQRIGGCISEMLARRGWRVAIHYFGSSDAAQALAEKISDAGMQASVIRGDLRDPEACASLVAMAQETVGPLGGLVNNASVFEPDLWDTTTVNSWNDHMSVNLRAPFLLSQAFAKALAPSSHGTIVNIIDQRVWNLRSDFLSYTVSKAGLWTLTQTLALALAPHIRVNAVGPGPTLANKRQSEADFLAQAASMPLGHGANPEDIADAVNYLLEARAVTGQMIAVDGGEHLGWAQADKGLTFDE